MNKILSNIGFNGPLILFVLVYILIIYYSYFGYKSYSFIYYIIIFVWQIFNYKINGILKQFIKQPRPANMKFINSSDKEAGKQYGMPSGHAQLTSSLMLKTNKLKAYGSNLLGSLCGSILITLLSYLWTPPLLWLSISLIIFLYLVRRNINIVLISSISFLILISCLNLNSNKNTKFFYLCFQNIVI